MRLPLRLAQSGTGKVEPGLVLSTAVATAVFSATPLVLPHVIEEYNLDVGLAGLVSGVQLGGFVITSFLAGRRVSPTRTFFVVAVLTLAIANLASALSPVFIAFVATRFVAGLALGALTWLAWSNVFGKPEKMGSIATIGPIAGVVASPMIGLVLRQSSFQATYALLAVLAVVPLLRIPAFAGVRRETVSRSGGRGAPVAYALIAGLGLMTMGGSAVFVFSGLIAIDKQGLSPFTFSLVLAANAAAGIPAARYTGARKLSGMWFVITGAAAAAFTFFASPAVGALALIVWGFSYWMAVPGAYQLLSERSRFPAERAGDAQATMAIGRIFGPLVGGVLSAAGSYAVLGLVGGGAIAAAGLLMIVVELGPARIPVLRRTSSLPSLAALPNRKSAQ